MNMVRIFNPVTKHEILIDATESWVFFHPREYEDLPYFEIKLMGGFNFMHHAKTCKNCGAFMNSFATNTLDWYLEYDGRTFRLFLEEFGKKNQVKYICSYYEFGTILRLHVHDVPLDKDSLIELREKLVADENYEEACRIRDLIKRQEE